MRVPAVVILTVICAWCKKVLAQGDEPGVSHGICETCRQAEREKLAARRGVVMTLYQKLVAAGCRIDSHESDLYTPDTPEARAIVTAEGFHFVTFIHQTERTSWLDVAFAYEPWWTARNVRL